ncbi:MAG: arylsulfatase, partial [Pirellulales bacterium]
LEAVRSGRWKLVFPHVYGSIGERPGRDGIPGGVTRGETDLALFDLQTDPGERYNLLDQHPNVVKRLEALAEKARADLGDSATERKGTGVREPGRI